MDQLKNQNFKEFDYLKKYAKEDIPSYIKNMQNNQEDNLHINMKYADHSAQEYPINSKENTYMSALHFACYEDPKLKHNVLENIKIACAFFGINNDVQKALKIIKSKISTNTNTKKFALEMQSGYNTDMIKSLPIDTIDDIEASASQLINYSSVIPTPLYYEACTKIKQAYDSINEENKKYAFIDKQILMDGTIYIMDERKMEEIVDERIKLSSDERYKIIKNFFHEKQSPWEQDELQSLRHMIYDIDVDTGLVNDYNNIKNPYKYANTDTTLKDGIEILQNNVKIADVLVPLAVFEKDEILDGISNIFEDSVKNDIFHVLKTASTTFEINKCFDKLNDEQKLSLLSLIKSRG